MPITRKRSWCLMAGITILSFIVTCGGGDANEETPNSVTEKTVQNKESIATTKTDTRSGKAPGLKKTIEELSNISQPIMTVGEVPDGFPTNILPLYPGAEVDRAALQPNEATVLQTSSDSEEKILAFYTKKYEAHGFETRNFVKVGGKNLGGFDRPECTIGMTLRSREDGKTFFSLDLSIK